ncbi:male-specific lethal 1 homolog isoform X1 [Labrus bergylta]|uniref:MSL complex subunit 1b n=1 Tax=Labrus bergylta TaxID=56723 RepID=A0A3Q3EYK6_9LABR|nr:male-specific lethal 1 homolog isoform X1 [Labrus bergylta]XP_020505481.1 male-specific lethal 1 homolog isoform X1 [Labrus bergylta]XP_020505482.1 male-specific lethal 1 homolog isoform X1 [Labrus bergylta]XP_020505483.1 male-specific lethal 1 homolog isoform X1 [Labrus bergylta]
MTLRATLFPNTGLKQDTDTVDFGKKHFGAATVSPVSLKRESRDFVFDVQNVQGGEIPSKSKNLEQNYMTSKVSLAATVAERVQGVGILSPVRQMGGEGTPVKGKPLSADNMDNTQMTVNNNPKDGGADDSAKGVVPGVLGTASIELSSEGKWRNIRKTPANPHTQANCLRQILLLQLDLIEQQQQQLQSKDKEIDELKSDKETLLARIERMERRLQLTRKDPPRDKRLFQPLEPWTPDKEDMWDLDTEESQQPNQATPLPFSRGGKGQKRKSCFGDPKVQKSRGKSSKLSPQKSELQPGSPNQRELRSKETPESLVPMRSGSDRDIMLPCKEEPELSCQMEDLPFMSTTEMYLCCWNQPPLSPLRETSPKKEEEVASEWTPHVVHDMLIVFPSWRENPIEPLEEEDDSGNPAEPLDDGVFLKRHMKLELDEKRRKRWDIQRIREQRMFQRLQQRMNRKKVVTETEPELSSFYPDTEDVETIVITPFLPVVAFGRPLPKMSQQNFELPWLDDRSRCRIEVPKKHTPHRTCRK